MIWMKIQPFLSYQDDTETSKLGQRMDKGTMELEGCVWARCSAGVGDRSLLPPFVNVKKHPQAC